MSTTQESMIKSVTYMFEDSKDCHYDDRDDLESTQERELTDQLRDLFIERLKSEPLSYNNPHYDDFLIDLQMMIKLNVFLKQMSTTVENVREELIFRMTRRGLNTPK